MSGKSDTSKDVSVTIQVEESECPLPVSHLISFLDIYLAADFVFLEIVKDAITKLIDNTGRGFLWLFVSPACSLLQDTLGRHYSTHVGKV